jgi:hypothetical protein
VRAVNRYLATYRPLASNAAGRAAIERYGLPPFIDGSCRREPDFESAFPSITAICRGGLFAPRLQVGDSVAYMTAKGAYSAGERRNNRLVAVLDVAERFESHSDAAEWYRSNELPLPSNCLVRDNPPEPYDRTVQHLPEEEWDTGYRWRARRWPVFLVTQPRFLALHDPPVATEATLVECFGRVPGTQNPGRLDNLAFARFVATFTRDRSTTVG